MLVTRARWISGKYFKPSFLSTECTMVEPKGKYGFGCIQPYAAWSTSKGKPTARKGSSLALCTEKFPANFQPIFQKQIKVNSSLNNGPILKNFAALECPHQGASNHHLRFSLPPLLRVPDFPYFCTNKNNKTDKQTPPLWHSLTHTTCTHIMI